ncbi:GD20355 [Drosophila simulans]|uniref:GD20355 n=1 Tax=Drosophila simulans TaxID=7240 RepID=B4QYI0_DROSI|nr:GD20355 [Drosophila simulans]
MSATEEVESVANEDAVIKRHTADCGAKRKSLEDITHNGNANCGADDDRRKRVKLEERVASIKDETNREVHIKIKDEPVEDAEHKDDPTGEHCTSIKIKTEPADNGTPNAGAVVKTEPTNSNAQNAVDESTVSSSSIRTSCRFGIRCYRRNPAHRSAEAHPGDQDYRRPNFPAPPLGTPACPFGNACYRRNPVHFQDYSHPADCK